MLPTALLQKLRNSPIFACSAALAALLGLCLITGRAYCLVITWRTGSLVLSPATSDDGSQAHTRDLEN